MCNIILLFKYKTSKNTFTLSYLNALIQANKVNSNVSHVLFITFYYIFSTLFMLF